MERNEGDGRGQMKKMFMGWAGVEGWNHCIKMNLRPNRAPTKNIRLETLQDENNNLKHFDEQILENFLVQLNSAELVCSVP